MDRLESIQEDIYDVIVIGGGISGGSAAYYLKKQVKDLRILILEAKNRLGGRTQTISLKCSKPNQTSRWDIGGQWVGEMQKNVNRLMKELGIETYRQYDEGKKLLESNGKISVYNSSVPCSSFLSWIDMQLYMKRVDRYVTALDPMHPTADSTMARLLDKTNARDFLYSKIFTKTVRSIVTSNMRTIYGLELEQVNALFGLAYIKAGGDSVEGITYSDEGCAQESRVKGGTQQISERCIQYVLNTSASKNEKTGDKLLLNTAVIEIIQNEEDENDFVRVITQNTITGERHEFRARKIISSIPINQYVNVNFKPELPYYKRNYFKFFQVGNYTKFLVTYKTQFWRSKGLSGEGTYDGSVMWLNEERFREHYRDSIGKLSFNKKMPTIGAVAEVFDGTNEENQPALIGFIAAKSAVEWADQSEELRRTEVIEDLVRMYGEEARNYIDYMEKNWTYEPYNGGCPCFNVVSSGVMEDTARATREPFLNVHFCGTESATVWQGYMDGAVQSGERVANEVLYTMFANNESIRSRIKIDYEKTFYYQREQIEKLDKADKLRVKRLECVKFYSKILMRSFLYLGFGYLIVKKYKINLKNIFPKLKFF